MDSHCPKRMLQCLKQRINSQLWGCCLHKDICNTSLEPPPSGLWSPYSQEDLSAAPRRPGFTLSSFVWHEGHPFLLGCTSCFPFPGKGLLTHNDAVSLPSCFHRSRHSLGSGYLINSFLNMHSLSKELIYREQPAHAQPAELQRQHPHSVSFPYSVNTYVFRFLLWGLLITFCEGKGLPHNIDCFKDAYKKSFVKIIFTTRNYL